MTSQRTLPREENHEHAWTWADDDSERMVCDDCGAEKMERWNPALGVYESTAVREGA